MAATTMETSCLLCLALMLLTLHINEGFVAASLAKVVTATATAAAAEEPTTGLTPAQRMLATVPASARTNFLLYQLAEAINSGYLAWPQQLEQLEQQEIFEHIDQVELHQQLPYGVDFRDSSSWLATMANEFQDITVYDSFPAELLNWLNDNYDIGPADVYHSIGSSAAPWQRSARNAAAVTTGQQLCNAQGQCYEIAQLANVCCPF